MVARLGRLCFRHRWLVLLGWLAAVTVGALATGPLFANMDQSREPTDVEAFIAYNVLAEGRDTGTTVLAVVDRVDPASPAVRSAVTAAATDIARMPGVRAVLHPYLPVPRARTFVAADRRAVLVTVELGGVSGDEHENLADDVGERLARIDPPGATVTLGGDRLLNRERNQAVQSDIQRGELLGLPVTLVVLVFVFGGIVAASLPVLAALATVGAAMAVLLGFSQFVSLDSNALTVVTLLSLGLSIDYGLLLVARYREEIVAGHEPADAVGRTWASAGRTILFSALTVAAAISGLLVFDVEELRTLGAAGIAAAVVAVLTALTLTAALIRLGGRWLRPSGRATGRHRRADSAEHGFFARIARMMQRRPVLVAVITGAALLAAGLPLLTASLKLTRLESLPQDLPAVQVANALGDRFGRNETPAVTVVARTDAATLDRWAARYRDDPAVAGVAPAKQVGPGLAVVDITARGDQQSDDAMALVHRLRADRPPAQSWVAGDAAVLVDVLAVLGRGLPWAILVMASAMIVLLFLMTGSVVIPLKAIAANLVSLGATAGVLVAVFQHGWLAGPLDALVVAGLDPFVLIILFAFAFGLSMDYEVFLLGRIVELHDQGVDTTTAVRRGLQHSGRIITSAALLMIIVFAGFAAARTGDIEELGLGILIAVLVDATIVRCLLVPSTMMLLGRWNWWAPAPLKRLHARFRLRESHRPPPDHTAPDDGLPVTAGRA